MIYYLLKNFFRSSVYPIGLILLLVSGLVSLEIGARFLDRVSGVSEKTAIHQQESIQRNVSYFNKEMGTLMYYLRFGLENETPRLSGLSIGQRDVYPSIQSLTIRNLEEQRYSTDLTNPLFQLLGNMDFSFVLIYLFPLVIIAFGFNLMSEEKEGGTWSLVRSQTSSPITFLRYKMGVRLGSVLLVLLILLTVAKFYLDIPLDLGFIIFGMISVMYVLFWFVLSWWVVSLEKSSSHNAQLLLSLWVVLNLLLPAGINVLQRWLFPIPEAMSAVIQNREGYHSQWDKPKEPTLEKFYAKYPEYTEFIHPKEADFSWLWYFAMQQAGDDEAGAQVEGLKAKLAQRQGLAKTLSWMMPSVHTQLSLNALSLSDMGNYLNYLTALEEFHEGKKAYFFPKIFGNQPVLEEDWSKFELEKFKDHPLPNWMGIVAPFVLVYLVLWLWASRNFKKSGIQMFKKNRT
jgi:ABC-2 type transport system permease protein